jgi:phosphoacetylglucosamine mutase
LIINKNLSSYNDGSEIKIIEGDHLSCLFALTVKFLIGKLSEKLQKRFLTDISIGVVITAYSNGAFINYVKNNLGFKLARAKTGVKHLSIEAKKFDIATYFESNGHGTLTYDDSIQSKIEKLESLVESSTDAQTLELLSIYISMFNKTVGDSLSGLICVESSMKLMNMSTKELFDIYKELEYVNIKACVNDKNIFVPNEDESRLIHPVEAQSFIDLTIDKYPNCNARCFVRPSGTEDIVRIYAEADTLEIAITISESVKKHIIENY